MKSSDSVKRVDRYDEERLALLRDEMQKTMRLEWMPPQQLAPNDLNWKVHKLPQRKALRAFMEELEERRSDSQQPSSPWAGALLFNERTGRLLDGHMRLMESLERGDNLAPVLVVDVDEATENLILRFLDQIGTMFDYDEKMLSTLDDLVAVESDVLKQLLGGDAEETEADEDEEPEFKRKQVPPGGLALPLGVKYDYVVLLFKTELDWNAAMDHFGIERQMCPFSGTVGIGRVVDGSAYLYRIRRQLSAAQDGVSAEPALVEIEAGVMNENTNGA